MTALEMHDTGSDEVVPLEMLSSKQAEAFRRLGELAELPRNWDSYGSPPPSVSAIKIVIDLIEKIDDINLPAVHLFPVSGGGVQMEWDVLGRELKLEIAADGTTQYLQVENGEPIREEEISPTVEKVGTLLTWLIPWSSQRRAA